MNDDTGRTELAKTMAGIDAQQALPASALAIQSTVELAGHDSGAVGELARVVLADPVLTERVLRCANAAALGVEGGVRTVTQAIFVLGFDTIRVIALSLFVLDRIEAPAQRETLSHEFGRAIGASCIARSLAATAGLDAERAAVLALMRAIGRLAVAAWAPAGYRAVRAEAQRADLTESVASRRVLGQAFHEIAQRAARTWGFPEPFAAAIGRELHRCSGVEAAAAFAADVIDAAQLDAAASEPRMRAVAQRVAGALTIPASRVAESVDEARAYSLRLATVLGVPDLLTTAPTATGATAATVREPTASAASAAVGASAGDAARSAPSGARPSLEATAGLASSETAERDAVGRPLDYRARLLSGLTALASAAVRSEPLDALAALAVEALHEAMGFQRTLFATREPHSQSYRVRHARGKDAQALLARWRLDGSERHVLAGALRQDVSLNIADASAPKLREGLPAGWRDAMRDAASFVLLPLQGAHGPIGFFYADRAVPDALTDATDIELLSSLRNQLLLALRAARAR